MPRLRPALFLPLAMAACNVLPDPYRQEGTWRPSGANEANLRVMAARPEEIVRGTGAAGADGATAAAAVDRLRTDRVRPLPDSAIVRIGGTNTQ